MKRSALIVFALLALTAAGPAMSAELMDDADLASVRGGIDIGPFANLSFACNMTTTVNGHLILSTSVQLTPQGEQMSQVAGAGTQNLSNAQQYGINVASLPQSGVVLPGQGGGGTAAIQTATFGQILNAVINTASNQTIVQATAIHVDMSNLPAVQQNASSVAVGGALMNAANAAAFQFSH